MERTLDRQQMANFINAVHRNDDGYITIASCRYGHWDECHYHGVDSMLDAIQETYSTKTDLFVSVNSFYLPLRKQVALRKINAIYADIDYNPLNTGDAYEKIYWPMQYELISSGAIPSPSLVIDSGNGMHLYWLIEPMPGLQGRDYWRAVSDGLITTLKNWMVQFKDIAKIDAFISKDSQRVMRLPGTYNVDCGRMCRIVLDHSEDIYSLAELKEKYGFCNAAKKKFYTPDGGNSFYTNLLTDLTLLRDMRRTSLKEDYRKRMTFLFRHFALLAGFTKDEALEMTLEFHRGFAHPYPDEKIKKQTWSAQTAYDQKVYYRYKIPTLVELLDITPAEMKRLIVLTDDLTRQQRRRARSKARYGGRDETGLTTKQRKMSEARAIVAELVKKGKTQSEISKLTGFSLSKIKRLRVELSHAVKSASAKRVNSRVIAGGSENRAHIEIALTPRSPRRPPRPIQTVLPLPGLSAGELQRGRGSHIYEVETTETG